MRCLLPQPTKWVLWVVEPLGVGGQLQRVECVHHHGQLFGALRAQALFHRARMRSVWNATRVQRNRANLDAFTSTEVAAHVIDHLVRVNVAVIVWHWHREWVVIQLARTERADDEPWPLEGLMDRRRLLQVIERQQSAASGRGLRIEGTT